MNLPNNLHVLILFRNTSFLCNRITTILSTSNTAMRQKHDNEQNQNVFHSLLKISKFLISFQKNASKLEMESPSGFGPRPEMSLHHHFVLDVLLDHLFRTSKLLLDSLRHSHHRSSHRRHRQIIDSADSRWKSCSCHRY